MLPTNSTKKMQSLTRLTTIIERMCLSFLDHLTKGIDVRFDKYSKTVLMMQAFIPSVIAEKDVTIDDIVEINKDDLPTLIIVKRSLFNGKEDGIFMTFQKDRRRLRKHWNSVIATHTQIFQSS